MIYYNLFIYIIYSLIKKDMSSEKINVIKINNYTQHSNRSFKACNGIEKSQS